MSHTFGSKRHKAEPTSLANAARIALVTKASIKGQSHAAKLTATQQRVTKRAKCRLSNIAVSLYSPLHGMYRV